ncbi:DUF4113 domain-containing protein [Alicycliphilus denitrificans]|uniref:DUF4113 domain-containing protein n=1 Tax=Alicycliphilus denitrificans TaxID=179636 RepID=UPI00384E203A
MAPAAQRFTPWETVYQQSRRWVDAGCFEPMLSDLRSIIRAAKRHQASVMLLDLVPDTVQQGELDLDDAPKDNSRLMAALDGLNGRFGRGTVHVASTRLDDHLRARGRRQERRTQQYTTHWDEVAVVRSRWKVLGPVTNAQEHILKGRFRLGTSSGRLHPITPS